MHSATHEPMIIELDDPTPRWLRYVAVAGAVLVAALLVLPWTMNVDSTSDATAGQTQQGQQVQVQPVPSYDPICQPRLEIPAFAEPAVAMALPSWMRICEWLAEPVAQPLPFPTSPAEAPSFLD